MKIDGKLIEWINSHNEIHSDYVNKKTKSPNFSIDTVNQRVYVFGIAHDEEERREVVNEAKGILYVKDVIASILLVEDLSRSKN